MKRSILLLCVMVFSLPVFATVWEVKQDSTGHFLHIQDAVNASVNDDIVLVWPGTYYENVDLLGKSITLASLAFTTGDVSYKYSTIINGNKTGSCVLVYGCENAVVHGFTLTNGSGYLTGGVYDSLRNGGGMFIKNSKIDIANCVVRNNKVNSNGGGIQILFSEVHLSGVSVYANQAFTTTGGIGIRAGCTVTFDVTNRCSIYKNAAADICDISKTDEYPTIQLVLDTFSVLKPINYFAWPPELFSDYDILHAAITPYDGDLYVNPQNGSDTNNGFTADEPLKTIFAALSKIVEDSTVRNTIHLANGVYSDTANGEKFPLNIRSHVIMQGESMDGVVWDGRYEYGFLTGKMLTRNYSFKNITMKRAYRKHEHPSYPSSFIFYIGDSDILLDSITVTNSINGANINTCNRAVVKNSVFSNNRGGSSALAIGFDADNPDFYNEFINCKFIDNMPNYDYPEYPGGGGMSILGDPYFYVEEHEKPTTIINCLFAGNNDNGLSMWLNFEPYIVNCTFVDNANLMEEGGVGLAAFQGADAHIYNSIFFDQNEDFPIYSSNYTTTDTAWLYFYNSLLEGGEASIKHGLNGAHYYDDSNIDDDPNFLGMWGDPYMIANGSPCINAGTLVGLPDFIELPETDLAGNPRIVGGKIDMGCYEWNETIVGFNEIGPGNRNVSKPKGLAAAPNPFGTNTTIHITYKSKKTTRVEIYDSYGLKVRTLLTSYLSGGNKTLQWDGTNNKGQNLPAGAYFVVMFYGEKEVESLKVVKR
ncbi:MAG: DUF1565 domain-containing protein [Bacteroidales bacterium]|nr:DUF1565 domain-containing protein [Bacteroidales bacterium]